MFASRRARRVRPNSDGGSNWTRVALRGYLPSVAPGIQFRCSLFAWWRALEGREVGASASDKVRENLWTSAAEVSASWPFEFRIPAQAAMNAQLGERRSLDSAGVEWIGGGSLAGSLLARFRSARVQRLRRAQAIDSLAMLDRVRHVKSLVREQGAGAIWWASAYPDRLHYLSDGSFTKLLELQPRDREHELSEANDEAAAIVREFLQRVADPQSREFISGPLKIVNNLLKDDQGEGGRLS